MFCGSHAFLVFSLHNHQKAWRDFQYQMKEIPAQYLSHLMLQIIVVMIAARLILFSVSLELFSPTTVEGTMIEVLLIIITHLCNLGPDIHEHLNIVYIFPVHNPRSIFKLDRWFSMDELIYNLLL